MGGRHQILLVDPETIVRHAIKNMIGQLDEFSVVAEADDVPSAVSVVSERSAPKIDIILSEIALPGKSGIELAHELIRAGYRTHFVALSRVSALEVVKQAFLSGFDGYILKNGNPSDIGDALQCVVENRKYVPPQVRDLTAVPEKFFDIESSIDLFDPLRVLSPREREIFHLLARGMQNAVIAKKLYISRRTVETHRARIIEKLQLSSSGELIHYAFKHGLTTG